MIGTEDSNFGQHCLSRTLSLLQDCKVTPDINAWRFGGPGSGDGGRTRDQVVG